MSINKIHKSLYKVVFIVFLLLQLFIDSIEFLFLFTILGSTFLAFEKNIKLSKSVVSILQFLMFISFVSIVVGVFHQATLYDKIKDFVHISKPIFALLLGFLITQKIQNKKFIIKTIIFIGLMFAFIHLFKLAFANYKEFSVEQIRLHGGIGSFIEMFALFLIINVQKSSFLKVIKKPLNKNILIAIFLLSFVLYFSRTMFLGMFLFIISALGYSKLTKKSIKIFAGIVSLLLLFYAYLFTLDLSIDDKGIDYFFFKIRNAPAEVFYAPEYNNYKDQKEVFKHWRAYEAKQTITQMQPYQYIIGKGIGSLVDVKFYAPIGGENGLRFIPHLHNGYIYVFFKAGLIGLLAYLVMLTNIYKNVYKKYTLETKNNIAKILSGFGLYFIFSSIIITGIYNLSEISLFCLGVFYNLQFNEK